MRRKRIRLMSIITALLVVFTVSIPTVSAYPNNQNVPAPQYRNMPGLPEDVEYNSAGVPILGKELPIANSNVYTPFGDLPSYSLYYINGYAIPFSSYPINSIWNGGEECVGFARYVYNTLWNNRTGRYFAKENNDTSSAESAEDIIESLPNGTRMTGYKDGEQLHTMIKVTHTAYPDGVVVYHANYSTTHNKVTLTYFTYEEFADLFEQISGYYPPA